MSCRVIEGQGLVVAVFALVLLPFVGSASARQQDSIALEQNRPIERQLSGDQKHRYQIRLAAGQYARVIVEQRGINVVERWQSSDGKLITESDGEITDQGSEIAELVADTDGDYVLEVEPRYRVFPVGRYQIRLAELRTAGEEDRMLQDARRQYRDASNLIGAGKYDEAQSMLAKVLEVREQKLGQDHLDVAHTLTLTANIGYYKGDYTKAEQLYQRAASIFDKVLGPIHPHLATSLNNLASVYQAKGDLTKSEELHLRALEIREKSLPADHPDIAQSLNNLANVYNARKDYEKAEPVYLRALAINEKILGPDHQNLAFPLNNLGNIYLEKREYDRAEPLLKRALAIRERTLGEDHPSVAVVLYNLGEIHRFKVDFAQALELHERGLAIREKRMGPNHPDVGRSLNSIASIYFSLGEYEKAEPLFQRALSIKENSLGSGHPDTVNGLNNSAKLYMMKGDLAQAVRLQERVITEGERNIDLNLAVGSERQKVAYLTAWSQEFAQTISLHARFAAADPRARDLAVTAILQRKGRVQDALSESFAALRSRFDPKDREVLDQYGDVTSQLANLVLNGPQRTTAAEHEKKITVLEEQREKLESEISRRSGGYYQHPRTVTLDAVRAAIPDNAALLEFAAYRPSSPKVMDGPDVSTEQRYVVYVIRKQGDIRWKELGAAQTIDVAVDAFRKALRDSKRKDVRELARAVDEEVMYPIRGLLGDATQLLISPDGALNLIPFEALVDEKGNYLVEHFSFSYLTSGRDLLRLQVARKSPNPPLLIVNPLFGESQSSSRPGGDVQSLTAGSDLANVYFAPLSATAREGQAIKSLFPEAVLMAGSQATESSLKLAVAPRILHVATHGFFLSDVPAAIEASGSRAISANAKIDNPLLRSGLALSGANLRRSSNEDGILTALEASGLNLWGTKLVVLSACDTGIGEIKNGEGVYGLRRAFVLAGTETLVMSLWPVSDYVTREMMVGYYTGLKQGQGRGAALRQAQLDMLKRKERQHPFYWASFIQSGEWANLDGRR